MDLSINFVPKMNMDVVDERLPTDPPHHLFPHCDYDRVRRFLSEYAPGQKQGVSFPGCLCDRLSQWVLFLGIIGRERHRLLEAPACGRSSNAHASSPLPYNSLFADFIQEGEQ